MRPKPSRQGLFPHAPSAAVCRTANRRPLPSQSRGASSGGFSCPASGKRYPFSRPGGSGNPGTPHTAKGHHTFDPPLCGLIPPVRASSRTGKPASPSLARPGRHHPAAFPAPQAGSGIRFPGRAAPAIPASLKRRKGRHTLGTPRYAAGAQCPANPFGEGRFSKRLSRTPLLRPFPARPFCGGLPHRQTAVPFPRKAGAAPSGGFSCPASGKRYPFSRSGGSGILQTAKRHHTIGTPPPCAGAQCPANPFGEGRGKAPSPSLTKPGRYHPAAFPALQAGSGIRFPDRAAPAIPTSLKRQKGIIRLELPRHAAGAQCPANPFGEGRFSKRLSRTPLLRPFPAPQTAVPFPRKAGAHHPAAGKRLCPGLFSALQNRPALLFVNFSESLLTLENRFYILCCAGISGGVCHRKIPSYLFTAGYSENNRADARHFFRRETGLHNGCVLSLFLPPRVCGNGGCLWVLFEMRFVFPAPRESDCVYCKTERMNCSG